MNHEIIRCLRCRQKLRIPSREGILRVTCPACGKQFSYHVPRPLSVEQLEGKRVERLFKRTAVSLSAVAVVVVLVCFVFFSKEFRRAKRIVADRDRWVEVSYGSLLDRDAVIRTGDTLEDALSNAHLRAAVQPFVDPYSYLLQHTVEFFRGPDDLPHVSVTEEFPAGSSQPAWAAIFRGGRIHMVADRQKHVRVFLPGKSAAGAYAKHYSVIRHALQGLIPDNGGALEVEVYAYRNDYASSILSLSMNVHRVVADGFPSPKKSISISGLTEFFAQTPQLDAAQLSRSEGLLLYGKKGARVTLAGHGLSLADFAAVYRAACHAGDNDAYISLDSNADPTKSTVNFGGFLEDTRVGSVVLESDKRFKTITSGLDPDTHEDMRAYIRGHVPSFLTVSERESQSGSMSLTPGKWIGTRFWFYPDDIGIDTDLNQEFASVSHPQFTADAERSREDFRSRAEFDKKKASALSPSIRKNIQQLNQDYTRFAAAFSELRELNTVARLMGICTWLKEARPRWLDLDALLAVELPAHATPRTRPQLIASTITPRLLDETASHAQVGRHSEIAYLTPLLDSTVGDFFSTPRDAAAYLFRTHGPPQQRSQEDIVKASRWLSANRNKRVRAIIRTQEELRAFAQHATGNVDDPRRAEASILQRSIDADEAALIRTSTQIEELDEALGKASGADYNELVDRYNSLLGRARSIERRYRKSVAEYNQIATGISVFTEISGGINLEPRNFSIRKAVNSPSVDRVKRVSTALGRRQSMVVDGDNWIRSASHATGSEQRIRSLSRTDWKTESSIGPDSGKSLAGAVSGEKHWRVLGPETGSWRSLFKRSTSRFVEKSCQSKRKTIHVVEFLSGQITGHLIGRATGKNRIVFSRAKRSGLIPPKDPPVWW